MYLKRSLSILALGCALGGVVSCGNAAPQTPADDSEITRASVQQLLRDVPIDTTWAQLDWRIKLQLQRNGDRTMDRFSDQWNARALQERSETLLRRPTAAMTTAFDGFVRDAFGTLLPNAMTYAASREMNPALRAVLTKLYLVRIAAWRLNVKNYANMSDRDWDGVDRIDDFPMPSARAIDDAAAYAQRALTELRALPAASLSTAEQAVRDKATYYLRQHAAGSSGFRGGDRDLLSPWGRAAWAYDLLWARTADAGAFMQDDARWLEIVNAYFLAPTTDLNVGTLHALPFLLSSSTDPASVAEILGRSPDTDPGARAFVLLARWYQERLNNDEAATRRACTVYSSARRSAMWESFSADLLFNNDGTSSLQTFRGDFQASANTVLAAYRDGLVGAVRAFAATPGSGVTAAQADQIAAAVQAETRFGQVRATATAAFDRVTGGTTASAAFEARFAAIPSLGGYMPTETTVRPADADALNRIWTEVRAFLATEYGIDGTRVDDALTLSTQAPSPVTGQDGAVTAGLKRARSEADWYSVLIHEAHHSVNFKSGVFVEGPAWEGAALSVEDQVYPRFITWALTRSGRAADAPFYIAARLQARGAQLAKTDATIQILLRDDCRGANSIDFARRIGESWGVTGDANLDDVAVRSHHGITYLQYTAGQTLYAGLLAYFRQQLGREIDPFQLQACGLAFATPNEQSANQLRTCLAMRP